jgi:hypothetical protein
VVLLMSKQANLLAQYSIHDVLAKVLHVWVQAQHQDEAALLAKPHQV